MITLKLKPRNADSRLLGLLEKKNLVKTLKPPKSLLSSREKNGALRTIYRSHPRWGAHKLICVKKNSPSVKLTFHPDNEEFILINNHPGLFRPLYIVLALFKQKELSAKLRKKGLSAADFIALRFRPNDHKTCVFTMLRGAVHCEVALPGKGNGPVFFVAEPGRLKSSSFRTKGYKLEVTG